MVLTGIGTTGLGIGRWGIINKDQELEFVQETESVVVAEQEL